MNEIQVVANEEYARHVKDMLYLLDDGMADVDTNLAIVSAWICGNITTKSAEEAVKKVLDNYKSKLSVFLVAMAQRKVKSIMRMLDAVERIEEELYRLDRWNESTDTESLLKASQQLQISIEKALDFIRKTLGGDQIDLKSLIVAPSITFNEYIAQLPSYSRDKVRQGLDVLIKKLNVIVGQNYLEANEENNEQSQSGHDNID